jgi:hypothetical protein
MNIINIYHQILEYVNSLIIGINKRKLLNVKCPFCKTKVGKKLVLITCGDEYCINSFENTSTNNKLKVIDKCIKLPRSTCLYCHTKLNCRYTEASQLPITYICRECKKIF